MNNFERKILLKKLQKLQNSVLEMFIGRKEGWEVFIFALFKLRAYLDSRGGG